MGFLAEMEMTCNERVDRRRRSGTFRSGTAVRKVVHEALRVAVKATTLEAVKTRFEE